MNLFTNAAHAARPKGGELRIDCRPAEAPGFILVRVADNGAGIRAADLEHVFEPFFTTKSAHDGFGLGLSIVRDIVHQHGGRIQVESTERVETTFFVWLPLTPHSTQG